MRGRALRKPEEAEVDLTPMLDVVFILLIFFIVTAVFTQEQAIGLEPPPPPVPTPPIDPPPTITIFINADGLIRVNGRPADIGSVQANIERLKAENPESSVIIQADRQAEAGMIISVRDQAYSAKATPVNIVLSGGE